MTYFIYIIIVYLSAGFLGTFFANKKNSISTLIMSIICSFYGPLAFLIFKKSTEPKISNIIPDNSIENFCFLDVPSLSITFDSGN